MVMAQSALATASVSNEELYGKMIAQAESIVKDAQEKGLEANEALKERQEALDKLKKEAAQNRKEVKEAMAKVRAEGRAGSAPAAPSPRLQADLDAGVHRYQSSSCHWERQDSQLEPKRHRGGHLKSERRRVDEARITENEAKMPEMSREGTPPWIHDGYEHLMLKALHQVMMI